MSDSADLNELFAGRPDTVHLAGVGEVPVHYADEVEQPLPPVGPHDAFAVADSVGWVSVEPEVVVYSAAQTTAHVLDGVAALLWQCLDGTSTLHEIFSDIADAFGQRLDDIADDLATVVAEWSRDGLIVRSGAGEPVSLTVPGSAPSVGTWRHLVDPPNN